MEIFRLGTLTNWIMSTHRAAPNTERERKGEREGRRERGREGEREREREGERERERGRERGREGEREGGRERGKERGRGRERERGKEREREGGREREVISSHIISAKCMSSQNGVVLSFVFYHCIDVLCCCVGISNSLSRQIQCPVSTQSDAMVTERMAVTILINTGLGFPTDDKLPRK